MRNEVREELGIISELGSHWFIARTCEGVCGSMARRYIVMMLSGHVKRLCRMVDCGSLDAGIYGVIDIIIRVGDELREGGDVEDHLIKRVVDEFVNALPMIERKLIADYRGRHSDR